MRKLRDKLQEIGIYGVFSAAFEHIYLRIIALYFRFPAWHYKVPFHWVSYKKITVELANKYYSSNTVEIGCGLGDIITRIDSTKTKLIGIDREASVIRAATKIRKKCVTFFQGDISELNRLNLKGEVTLIMVNWIHEIPLKVLTEEINLLRKNVNLKYLILDQIPEQITGYPYYHNFLELDWTFEIEDYVKTRSRTLVVLKAINNETNYHTT